MACELVYFVIGEVEVHHLVSGLDLRVAAAQASQLTGGRVSRFTSIDEEPPFGNKPEWGGQLRTYASNLVRHTHPTTD